MELRQLEHFVAVAEDGSFTRAARRLGYVQSALSVSVATIERELDVRLFDRTTHRVELTDAGRELLGPARATLAAAAEVRSRADAVNGVLTGTLRIGIMQALTPVDIPALLGEFHRDHPGVEIAMRPSGGGSAALLRSVASGELDVAFVAAIDAPANVSLAPLGREPLEVTTAPRVTPDHSPPTDDEVVSLEQIRAETFIDFPVGWGVRTVADRAFDAHGLHRHVAIEVADVVTLLALVEHGLGTALLPPSLSSRAKRPLHRRTLTPEVHFEIGLATRNDCAPSAAAAVFLTRVEAALGARQGASRSASATI